MSDLKHRMSSLESAMVLVKREVSSGDEADARKQVMLDRLMGRLERIERRLDLIGNRVLSVARMPREAASSFG